MYFCIITMITKMVIKSLQKISEIFIQQDWPDCSFFCSFRYRKNNCQPCTKKDIMSCFRLVIIFQFIYIYYFHTTTQIAFFGGSGKNIVEFVCLSVVVGMLHSIRILWLTALYFQLGIINHDIGLRATYFHSLSLIISSTSVLNEWAPKKIKLVIILFRHHDCNCRFITVVVANWLLSADMPMMKKYVSNHISLFVVTTWVRKKCLRSKEYWQKKEVTVIF